jgi:hypothetical protein
MTIARFQNLPLKVESFDGRNFDIVSNLYFTSSDGTKYCVPCGAKTDGASTPRAGWSLIPPFGKYWPAAVLHDSAYQNTLLIWNCANWVKANLTKDQCDLLLKEAMQTLGVNELELELIYKAVVYGGERSFEEDRANATP